MSASTIEWTDATWNPVRGCNKVSPGCKNCYAETFAERWRGVPGHPYEQGFDLRLVPHKLGEPLKWKKPQRIFVNSMSDLFHDDVPNEYIAAVFGVMAACPHHTFQVLTKRAERMEQWFKWLEAEKQRQLPGCSSEFFCLYSAREAVKSGHSSRCAAWPLPNVWLGVSVENNDYRWRIEHLRRTPAAVRFVSAEPLLGPLDVSEHLAFKGIGAGCVAGCTASRHDRDCRHTFIDWVITGAESGHGARPMNDDWVRSLRDQCEATGTSFFLKQKMEGRKKVSLPILDGTQHAAFPEACHA